MVSSFIPKDTSQSENMQAVSSKSYTNPILPQVQVYCHAACEDFKQSFTELTFRNEGFKPTPLVVESSVLFQELLETPSTIQGEWR